MTPVEGSLDAPRRVAIHKLRTTVLEVSLVNKTDTGIVHLGV